MSGGGTRALVMRVSGGPGLWSCPCAPCSGWSPPSPLQGVEPPVPPAAFSLQPSSKHAHGLEVKAVHTTPQKEKVDFKKSNCATPPMDSLCVPLARRRSEVVGRPVGRPCVDQRLLCGLRADTAAYSQSEGRAVETRRRGTARSPQMFPCLLTSDSTRPPLDC